MRIGVISDIHGNDVALEAALADLASYDVDQTVCLGDALQGGCQPREVVDRLRDVGCPIVLGNADAFVLTGSTAEAADDAGAEQRLHIRDWTVEQLGPDGLEFIRTFVPTHEIDLGGTGTLLCFHGSPRSYDDVLLPQMAPADLARSLDDTDANVLCGGHTHLQWTARIGEKTFFNPGSIGLAYNRFLPRERFFFHPIAEYAVLSATAEGVHIEFKHVPFDVDTLERAALSSGHPMAATEAARFRPPSR